MWWFSQWQHSLSSRANWKCGRQSQVCIQWFCMNLGLSCPTQNSVCVCRIHCIGVRKESPASSFPLVAWSDDDVTVGGLEVQGIVGNEIHIRGIVFRNYICVVVVIVVVLIKAVCERRKSVLGFSPRRNIVLCQQYVSVSVCERGEGLGKR